MGLTINSQLNGDIATLELAGRLWILDLPLRDVVHGLLENGAQFFIVNIERVDYMDSSGLGQLVSLWTSVRTKGGNLVLLRPSDRVRRLFSVTRLHVVFDVFQDQERALASIRR